MIWSRYSDQGHVDGGAIVGSRWDGERDVGKRGTLIGRVVEIDSFGNENLEAPTVEQLDFISIADLGGPPGNHARP
jgi:hypothetical protein